MSIGSNAKQMGKDLLSSLTGNTDKACLVIHDVRAKSGNLEPELGAGSALGEGLSKFADQRQKTQDALNQVGSTVTGGSTQADDKIFFVQFNPNSLQIYSSNYHDDRRDLSGNNQKQHAKNDAVTAPKVDLSFMLIFDQMNVYDSFMGDKIQGANVSTVTNAITGLAKTFTVQPYVEGLISAIRNPYTKSMTFQWADFSFTGILTSMHAAYTMFSVSGRPVRAQVQLRLRQELNRTELNKWHADFAEMVGDRKSLTSAGQRVGNMINLSL